MPSSSPRHPQPRMRCQQHTLPNAPPTPPKPTRQPHPLRNLNCNPGLLFQTREKLGVHSKSGACFLVPHRVSLRLICQKKRSSSFLDGKAKSTDEPIPRAALREAKEVGIDKDNIEIPGRFGPPAQSSSCLRRRVLRSEFQVPRSRASVEYK